MNFQKPIQHLATFITAMLLPVALAAPLDAQSYRLQRAAGANAGDGRIRTPRCGSSTTSRSRTSPGGHAIDVVDIGTPHADYNLGNVRASIDDRPLRDIRVSTYVKPGFEVHLGAGTIPPRPLGPAARRVHHAQHGLPGHDPLRLRLAADHAHVVWRPVRPSARRTFRSPSNCPRASSPTRCCTRG